MLAVADRLRDDAPLDDVLGIGFKRDGKLVFTPERPLRRLEEMPAKAYQLADFDAYEKICGRRWAMYVSSLACPFNCAYCTMLESTDASGVVCRSSKWSKRRSN